MGKASEKIRSILDGLASAEPSMTSFMAALPNHHGGGGLEWGAKAEAWSRHEDGEVRGEESVLKTLTAPVRALVKDLGLDPKTSNPCLVAFRGPTGLSVSLLVVSPGDVAQGQWASYASSTEKEEFAIANGPRPYRYPYARMPHPTGTVVTVLADGSSGDPVRTLPPTGEWYNFPIDWSAVAGMPSDMVAPDPVPETADGAREGTGDLRGDGRQVDPFVTDVLKAIRMDPPGIRDIRRIGVPNGFRDERGRPVD